MTEDNQETMECLFQFTDNDIWIVPNDYVQSQRKDVAEKMDNFRASNQFCDIILRVDDGLEIPAHRVVLAAASPYFHTLFSSGFADSSQKVHELPWLNAKLAQSIVRFMYTGNNFVSLDIVIQALAAAEFFMLPQLKRCCAYVMLRAINKENVFHMMYLAEFYQLEILNKEIDCILEKSRYGEIFQDKQLLVLPLEFIRTLILNPRFKHIREAEIADFVLRWVEHDAESRVSSLDQLFGMVLSDCLPLWFIKKMAQNKLIKSSVSCSKLLDRAQGMYHSGIENALEDIVLVMEKLAQPPCVGYIPRQDQWVKFNPLPMADLQRRYIKILGSGNKMYLLATLNDIRVPPGVDKDTFQATQFWCLDIEANSWTQLPPPISNSRCYHLINVGSHICAIGTTGTIERYDIEEEAWLSCSPAPQTLEHFNVLEFTDNKTLFVLSIHAKSYPQGYGHLLLSYDPLNDSWTSSILSNKDRHSLSSATYHLMRQRPLCQRGDHGRLKLFDVFGTHWGDIDIPNNSLKCWTWKKIVPQIIYYNNGLIVPMTDLSALFIMNSIQYHCAMYNLETGCSKLTAACPTKIYIGNNAACAAKISVSARQRLCST